MKQAFQYNLIRFQPDAETGEFANIGVIIFAPASNTLAFRLLTPAQHQRVTAFFQPMDNEVLQATLALMETELQRVQKLLPTVANPTGLYEELIRPREDIIRYAPTGVVTGDNPQQSADQLFNRYVNREHSLAA